MTSPAAPVEHPPTRAARGVERGAAALRGVALGIPSLAGAALAVLVGTCFAALLVAAPLPPRALLVVDDVAQLAAAVLAAWCCARAARGQAVRGRRAGWALLAAAAASYALGQAAWSTYELVLGRAAPFPSVADVGFVGFPLLAAAGLLVWRQEGHRRRSTAWLRDLLDGAVTSCALLIVVWDHVLDTVLAAGAPTATEVALALAQPVGDVVLVNLVLLCAARSTGAPRSVLAVLALALCCLLAADSAQVVLSPPGADAAGSPVSAASVTGFLLLALAARAARRACGRPVQGSGDPCAAAPARPPGPLGHALPHVPLVVAVLHVSLQLALGRAVDAVVVALGVVIVVLAMTRQVLLVADNEVLLARLRAQEARLQHEASHDPLTGLANRAVLRRRVAEELCRRDAPVLLLDLDGFKQVNDTHGHPVGDALLQRCAERLRAAVRPGDLVARLGGDEFAVLLGDGDAGAALKTAQRVVAALAAPVHVGERVLAVAGSVGVSRGARGSDVDDEIAAADLAMYAAKAAGAGRVEVYRDELRAAARRRRDVEEELRTALAAGALDVHYQPVVRLDTGRVVGVEALARWTSSTRGPVPPAEVVPVAEESGLVAALGEQVLAAVCRTTAPWVAAGADLRVGGNVSPRQLESDDLLRTVDAVLARTGLPAQHLVLEVTESGFVSDAAVRRLAQLRERGVRIAVDDFGTGWSSLSYLARLPVDIVKVDRSFVAGLGDPRGRALVEGVLLLCDRLGYDVVAEGVETEEDREALLALGCHYGQGYLFARPVPAAALAALLDRAPAAARG